MLIQALALAWQGNRLARADPGTGTRLARKQTLRVLVQALALAWRGNRLARADPGSRWARKQTSRATNLGSEAVVRKHRADDPGSPPAEEADLSCHYNPNVRGSIVLTTPAHSQPRKQSYRAIITPPRAFVCQGSIVLTTPAPALA